MPCMLFFMFAGMSEPAGAHAGGLAQWETAWKTLLWSFAGSGAYSLAAGQVNAIKTFPVFSWVGLPAATAWG